MTRPRMLPLVAAAGLSCSCALAVAQNVQLSGVLDAPAGRFQPSGQARQWRIDSGGLSPSFLSVRGNDDLGGGIRARFVLEHDLRLDSGTSGRFAGDAFWSREASVGLSGAFGTTMLGRNPTPLYTSAVLFNAFGDSTTFSPSLRLLFGPTLEPFLGDTRWNNSIAYTSPDHDGFIWAFAANLGEGAAGANGKNIGGNLRYTRGPLAATFAWQKARNGAGISIPGSAGTAPPDFRHQETWLLGLAYDVQQLKLFGEYGHVHTESGPNRTTKLWSLGASVPLGPGRLMAQYGDAKVEVAGSEPRHRVLSIGYDYELSRRTDLYAVYMGDKVSGLSSGRTFAGGMRLRF